MTDAEYIRHISNQLGHVQIDGGTDHAALERIAQRLEVRNEVRELLIDELDIVGGVVMAGCRECAREVGLGDIASGGGLCKRHTCGRCGGSGRTTVGGKRTAIYTGSMRCLACNGLGHPPDDDDTVIHVGEPS